MPQVIPWPQGPQDIALAHADIDRYFCAEVLTETIPQFKLGTWRLSSCQVTAVMKKMRKFLIFGSVSYQDMTDDHITAEMVAKVYRSNRGAGAFKALRQLGHVGMHPPSMYQVPYPYGYSSELRTLYQGKIQGQTWADFLEGDENELLKASCRAADWLVQIHQSPLKIKSTGTSHIAALKRHVQELSLIHRLYAPRFEALAETLTHVLTLGQSRLVPSHGDYHPKNVFMTSEFTAAIDLDTFAMKEPAFDIGYAISQLLIMSYFRTGGFAVGAKAALAFWQAYQAQGQVQWSRVAIHSARTFLQSLHYELCVLRNQRFHLVDLWLELAEEVLNSHGPSVVERLIPHS